MVLELLIYAKSAKKKFRPIRSLLWKTHDHNGGLWVAEFFFADLAHMTNSMIILPLVIFWFGHYFKKKFSENPLLGPVPQIFFKDP